MSDIKRKPLFPEMRPLSELPKAESVFAKPVAGGRVTLVIKLLLAGCVIFFIGAQILYLIYTPRRDWQTPEQRARNSKIIWKYGRWQQSK